MEKLQRNFTNPKQSRLLLELGVPEWTADCCFSKSKDSDFICEGVIHIIPDNFCVQSVPFPAYPCWSIGRLIEIDRICSTLPDEEYMFPFWKDQEDNVEWVIRVLESGIKTGHIDFSELEK